ncbi:glycerol-3-phosphate dehydrogenase [soil metagenome]
MASYSNHRELHLSVHDRPQMIEQMKNEIFDLVIIGGGITGAGVARDAASRGMKVALIEDRDFAIGTSSRSSKLIHGGIRYLENYEFHLVFEALSERALLFDIAPNLVHPLRFVLPLYEGNRVGMFKMGLGMWAYDALSLFEAPEPHERLSADETVERLPLLQRTGLQGSYAYSDAYMDDDRLVLETLRSAVSMGALAVNRVRAADAVFVGEKVTEIVCDDHVSGQKFNLRAKHFVSTVGPWTDRVAVDLLGKWKKVLRPAKGIHLTFNRSRFNVKDAIVMAADNEKRIVFGIPRHEMFIIGTTDTDYPGDPKDVSVLPEDVDYLMGVANQYFPGAALTKADIIGSYAGVRPLVDDGAETESKTSREHLIYNDERNMTFVAGGKYTTYRRMALDAVESTLDYFDLNDRVRFGRPQTEKPLNPHASVESLNNARRSEEQYRRQSGLSKDVVAMLVERHAAEAPHLFAFDPGAEFTDDERMWTMEAKHAIRETMCDSLVDFYARRVPLVLSRADHGLPFLGRISRAFQEELKWTDQECADQSKALQEYLNHEFAWRNR